MRKMKKLKTVEVYVSDSHPSWFEMAKESRGFLIAKAIFWLLLCTFMVMLLLETSGLLIAVIAAVLLLSFCALDIYQSGLIKYETPRSVDRQNTEIIWEIINAGRTGSN